MPEGPVTRVPLFEPMSAWVTEALTDDSRAAFFAAVKARQANTDSDARKVRQLGLMCGAAGLMVGTLGILAALIVYVKTPVPPPPGYILVDKTTGTIERAVAAEDVPRIYPETVRERALRDFIVACESFVPETFARLDYHACMVMATPAEQKRRADDIGPRGTRYPPTVFGAGGWAMPSNFYAFTSLGSSGVEPNVTYHYQVRYERTEVTNGKESRPRYTARLDFSFHPELKISARDRLLNPSGLQVVAFSTTAD